MQGYTCSSKATVGSCKIYEVCETNCPTKAIEVKSDVEIKFDYGAAFMWNLCKYLSFSKLENSGLVYVFAFNREEIKNFICEGDFVPKEFPTPENVGVFKS